MTNPERVIALDSLGNKCSICGSTLNLAIHHKDHDPNNNTLENLVLLCRSCNLKDRRLLKPKSGSHRKIISASLDMEIISTLKTRAEKRHLSISRLVEEILREKFRL